MGRTTASIQPDHRAFIEAQRVFFVATAAPGARINLSPKGMDSLRVLGPHQVAWLNLTGSGNETAAHLREDPRMTLMFCSFEGDPLTLRLYGQARAIHTHDPDWATWTGLFPPIAGPRQVILMDVDLVQTSCGYGTPLYAYQGERPRLGEWLEGKGEEGIRRYWRDKNRLSLDGRPTGILEEGAE